MQIINLIVIFCVFNIEINPLTLIPLAKIYSVVIKTTNKIIESVGFVRKSAQNPRFLLFA